MTAVATVAASPTLTERLGALESGQRTRMAIGALLLVAVVVGGILLGSRPDYRVLYANLAD